MLGTVIIPIVNVKEVEAELGSRTAQNPDSNSLVVFSFCTALKHHYELYVKHHREGLFLPLQPWSYATLLARGWLGVCWTLKQSMAFC